eukprot:TRINITY_DN4052_c0_g1_i1.p1 TRINITY_DN4052_c0_g1~~TRINITY_DN4052_c0_g1_i1.p1  ORF type:complete len:676 (-),score=152.50 TRINITY_DN4052_c0_g1_i1:123-2150(-)
MGATASGAKDLGLYNLSFNGDIMPPESSITCEGMYNQYYFETGYEDKDTFSASFYAATSKDPFNHSLEHYVAVGLNSKFDGDGIRTLDPRPLNLVILLDISGSMSSPFSLSDTGVESRKPKLEVAKTCILSILNRLKPHDHFSLVLFDDNAIVTCPTTRWDQVNVIELKEKILSITTQGGTTLNVGLAESVNQLKEHSKLEGYNNRIMMFTDAEPNNYDEDSKKMLNIMRSAADRKIYTTVVGVGVDFNVEMIEQLTKVKSASYNTVESKEQFEKLMNDDFDYIVFPVAFDVKIKLNSPDFTVERVYGSPGNEIPTDDSFLKITSIFPSAKESKDFTKGGVILVKLRKNSPTLASTEVSFSLEYTDYEDKLQKKDITVKLDDIASDTSKYANSSVRKAILIARYVNLLKHWIIDRANEVNGKDQEAKPTISESTGILPPPLPTGDKPSNHRIDKIISPHYRHLFQLFSKYLIEESNYFDDESVIRDIDEKLTNLATFYHPKDISLHFDKLETDKLTLEEVVRAVELSMNITFNDTQKDVVVGLRTKRTFDHADLLLEEYLNESKIRLVKHSVDELKKWLISKWESKNWTTDCFDDRLLMDRLQTRTNNYFALKFVWDKLLNMNNNERVPKLTSEVLIKTLEKEWGIEFDDDLKKFVIKFVKHSPKPFEELIQILE